MAILVANIGTSDLAVKVDGYYLPIGFDRDERNLERPESEDLKKRWNERTEKVKEVAQAELGLDLSGQNDRSWFREVSGKLWERYQQAPDVWHDRIRIGRLLGVIEKALGRPLGVIEKAQQSGLSPLDIHLVVTDQPQSETQGYPSDTVYAFDISQFWLKREFPKLMADSNPKLRLTREVITFKAIEQDQLFEYYDRLFGQFDPDEEVYVSFKGGTPPMQTALKIQAIAAPVKVSIFLEPKLNVMRILKGKPSECDSVAYWRYQQSQTYRSVRQLLTRWDFDGAKTLLEAWNQISERRCTSVLRVERLQCRQR